jgi:glycosyltransferase involved in cell wall biosynthesis
MRILHILNHTNRLNGHVHAAVDLACAQAKLGHDVCVASGGGDFEALLRRNKVETVIIDHQRTARRLVTSAVRLKRHIQTWQADIVHAHMMTSAVLAWPVCRLAGIPLITTVHNAFEKSAVLMGLGKRVIAVSAAVADSMHKRGIPRPKLRVVLNGTIGSSRFDNRDAAPAKLASPSILFVGGLHPRKGLPDLFEAFGRAHLQHPEARLYVVGEGPFGAEYWDAVAQMQCAPAVTFLGAQDDPYPWMAAADIFVLPSKADPAPLVLSEAREARCAVIGTNVDGIPELLECGAAGILVPASDPQALADAFCELLADPVVMENWKANSQIRIEHMHISRVAEQTLDVYSGALSSVRARNKRRVDISLPKEVRRKRDA